jgi:hypothetical protein
MLRRLQQKTSSRIYNVIVGRLEKKAGLQVFYLEDLMLVIAGRSDAGKLFQ